MNSTTFALLVFVGVVSMIAGYLLKYMQDIKHFKEIEDIYEEAIKNMTADWKNRELRYQKRLNQMQTFMAETQLRKPTAMGMRNMMEKLIDTKDMDESVKAFFDLSQTLPDDNGIDFGGF